MLTSGLNEATLRTAEQDVIGRTSEDVILALFVAGASDLSVRAISNVRALCEVHLSGRFQLVVIDVHQTVAAARVYDVLATPTLIKEYPLPERRVVGDLSDSVLVLAALRVISLRDDAEGNGT